MEEDRTRNEICNFENCRTCIAYSLNASERIGEGPNGEDLGAADFNEAQGVFAITAGRPGRLRCGRDRRHDVYPFQYDTEEDAITVGQSYVALKKLDKLKEIFAPKKTEETEPKPEAPTLSEYYKRFEKVYLRTCTRQGTQDRYADSFAHILPELGPIPLNEIERDRIKDFIAHLVGKKLAKSSIRIMLSQLCKLFSYALEEDKIIQVHPALKLGRSYSQAKNARERIQPLSAEEVEVFLAAVLNRSWSRNYYPVFLCALHTGMRASEIVGLRWSDCDFHGKFFMLWRQFTRGRIEPTKTGKPRRVDMSDALAAELLALKKKRQAEYLAKGSNEIPEWVFCNAEGKPLDYYNLRRRHFEKCLDHACLRRIRFHDLRHTYATLLLMQGESPAYVKEQLGHSSIKVTVDIYCNWIPGNNRQAVNKLPAPGVVYVAK